MKYKLYYENLNKTEGGWIEVNILKLIYILIKGLNIDNEEIYHIWKIEKLHTKKVCKKIYTRI